MGGLPRGRRSHSFAHVRDPAWLKARLKASARVNMKGEDPKLLCYAPKGARKIPIGP